MARVLKLRLSYSGFGLLTLVFLDDLMYSGHELTLFVLHWMQVVGTASLYSPARVTPARVICTAQADVA